MKLTKWQLVKLPFIVLALLAFAVFGWLALSLVILTMSPLLAGWVICKAIITLAEKQGVK